VNYILYPIKLLLRKGSIPCSSSESCACGGSSRHQVTDKGWRWTVRTHHQLPWQLSAPFLWRGKHCSVSPRHLPWRAPIPMMMMMNVHVNYWWFLGATCDCCCEFWQSLLSALKFRINRLIKKLKLNVDIEARFKSSKLKQFEPSKRFQHYFHQRWRLGDKF
jgi:hypothetical protein